MADVLDTGERRTVLVVDDAPENLQILHALLKDEYKVKLANNGEQALAVAAQEPRPDTILLDIMMPGLDGFEVCRRLKADRATRDIPVIFLTGKNEIDDAQLAFDVGCADYITKPILPPVVLARVKAHVSLKIARDFLRDRTWT
jgi:putative two-component system response regulator